MESKAIIPANCHTQDVAIDTIKILKRIRQNALNIDALAEDIKWNGLINPPTVLDNGDQTYTLITGYRRLLACRKLEATTIRVTILTAIEADDMLSLEFAENVERQDFTVSERLEWAEKIKEIEKRHGRERMSEARRTGQPENEVATSTEGVFHGTHLDSGKSRDIIAKKVGLSSGVQYSRLSRIADARPDLLEKIDSGELSVRQAYMEAFHTPEPDIDAVEKELENNEPEATPSYDKKSIKPVSCDDDEPLSDNVIPFPKDRIVYDPRNDELDDAPVSYEPLPDNVIPFPRKYGASNQEREETGAFRTAAQRAELQAAAEADSRAYKLTKSYNSAIYSIVQLSASPEAVREWVGFSEMDSEELKGALSDVHIALDKLGRIERILTDCLRRS